jgi:hypothetical protein
MLKLFHKLNQKGEPEIKKLHFKLFKRGWQIIDEYKAYYCFLRILYEIRLG